MKLKVFSVFDSKIKLYGQPFYALSEKQVIFGFTESVNSSDPKSDVARWPEDYTLFELGEYEEETGTFNLLSAPCSIVNGISLKKSVSSLVRSVPSQDGEVQLDLLKQGSPV